MLILFYQDIDITSLTTYNKRKQGGGIVDLHTHAQGSTGTGFFIR